MNEKIWKIEKYIENEKYGVMVSIRYNIIKISRKNEFPNIIIQELLATYWEIK